MSVEEGSLVCGEASYKFFSGRATLSFRNQCHTHHHGAVGWEPPYIDVVYHFSTKSPAEIEEAGVLEAPILKDATADQVSVYQHVYPASKEKARQGSVYLTMTRSEKVAASRVPAKGWIYMLHASPNMFPVEETLGNNNEYSHRTDVLALRMVYWAQIMAFSVVDVPPAGVTPLNTEAPWFKPWFEWERNPGYQPAAYAGVSMSPGQPQLAGYPATHRSCNESDAVRQQSSTQVLHSALDAFERACLGKRSCQTDGKPLPPCQGQPGPCKPTPPELSISVKMSDSNIGWIADACSIGSLARGTQELACAACLEGIAREFSAWKHHRLVAKLQIDVVKSRLRPLSLIRQNLGNYMTSHGKVMGFGRISKFVKSGFRLSSSLVKSITPGSLDAIAWGIGMYAAFSQDTTALTRAAALLSIVPVIKCVLEDQVNKQAGSRNAVDFVACTIGDVLLFTPLFLSGFAIGGVRTVVSLSKYLKSVGQHGVNYYLNVDNLQRSASTRWNDFGQQVLTYVESPEFQSLNQDQFMSEVITVQFAAAEELSVTYVGHEMIMANSSNDEERESIRLSLARRASRQYTALCDEISVRREKLVKDTHDRLVEWVEESRMNFTHHFYEAWKGLALDEIDASYRLDTRIWRESDVIESFDEYLQRRERARTARQNRMAALNQTMEKAKQRDLVNFPSYLRPKRQDIYIPEEMKLFCAKYRHETTTSCQGQPKPEGCVDGGQPVDEDDCRVWEFWSGADGDGNENLVRLRRGDLRCKHEDRSYGMNRLLFTSCPLGASKTSLLCESKPVEFRDEEDFRNLSKAGLFRILDGRGPQLWKPADLWQEQETAVIDCKAKNITWDFFDQYTVAVAQGNMWCKFGKHGQLIRWIGNVVEHCQAVDHCRFLNTTETPLSDNLVRRAAIFSFPALPPPPPSQARLVDCQQLGINWDVSLGRNPLLPEASRRVADGLDRCGRRDRPGHWFQWQPAWSLAQEESRRNYSSLVEYVDGEPRYRLDYDGGGSLNESILLDARLVGMPRERPPTDEVGNGRAWDGIPPKLRIICHALPWKQDDKLQVRVVANGLVGCGQHGSVATWHWAEGKKLVRCIPTFSDASQFSCVFWNDIRTMSLDFQARATSSGVVLDPPTEHVLAVNTTLLQQEAESSELEEVSAVAGGCARISSLNIALMVGSEFRSGSNDQFSIGFGRNSTTTDWIWLAPEVAADEVVRRNLKNLTEAMPRIANQNGMLHLRDLGPVKIKLKGYTGLSGYATVDEWLPNSKPARWGVSWEGDMSEADWQWLCARRA
ncbi:hypothetical protein L249_8386 [Ophiocordyceps polyrhachis-furcata BCC 54312]|uniref:Uncharacterized protein n=1 Tax=Ophiocordyceps polyrhachis-furcata BCC 54312 TaxID=1330021 RepID=A0A367L7D0_9HYPO|nr:hypothetical protein L249_8386 [Ophiocordyceps polyrhachis-furcata BCC 54312]